MKKHIAHDEGYQYVPLDDWTNFFYTTDFDLSVCLLCNEYNLVTIDAEPSGKKIFVFKNDAGIGDVIDGYWSNRIEVKPLEFANARKNLKSRLYGMRQR